MKVNNQDQEEEEGKKMMWTNTIETADDLRGLFKGDGIAERAHGFDELLSGDRSVTIDIKHSEEVVDFFHSLFVDFGNETLHVLSILSNKCCVSDRHLQEESSNHLRGLQQVVCLLLSLNDQDRFPTCHHLDARHNHKAAKEGSARDQENEESMEKERETL